MNRDPEPTISFKVSQFLVMLEGPPPTLALLLDMLSGNKDVDRKTWGLSHNSTNRATFVTELRRATEESRRLGLSVETQTTVDIIVRLANTLKIKNFVMSGGGSG
jgi:hypothetical protein